MALLMMVAGISFIGHDWNTGSMTNQLLFSPRRGRVWVTKALAVTVPSIVLAAVMLGLWWLGLWTAAHAEGIRIQPAVAGLARDQVVVGSLMAGGAALGGYVLTMLLRSTVASLGLLFLLTAVVPFVVTAAGLSRAEPWLPHANVAAVALDGYRYYDDSSLPAECSSPQGPPRGVSCDGEQVVGRTHGTAYLGGGLAVLGLASFVSFRRRDVP